MQFIDNGTYQLAMIALSGWGKAEVLDTKGLNPVKSASTLLNVSASFDSSQSQPAAYATLMLWKKSGEKWTDTELLPVKQLRPAADGTVDVQFADGRRITINYK